LETELIPDPLICAYFTIQNFISGNLVGLCIIVLLLLLSAIISGSKLSFFLITPENKKLFSERKDKKAQRISRLLENQELLSATLLISGILVNIIIIFIWIYLSGSALQTINISKSALLLIELSSIIFILAVFCELVPRIIASHNPYKFCNFASTTIHVLNRILSPLSKAYHKANSFVDKNLIKKKHELSMSNLSDAIEMSEDTSKENKKILEGIASYGSTYSVEIMRPRVDVVAFDISLSFAELIEKIKKCNYSRIPVYQETFDSIKGILYVKDLLPHIHKKTFNWQTLIRPAYFVPESKKINDLLLDFQTKKIHLAVVIDEYSGTSGIVTLEDVLEEIIGEIVDESDSTNEFYKKVNENNYIFEGKTLMNDFYKIIHIEDDYFDEIRGDAETLAGMILEIFGEIPKTGSSYNFKQFLFTILSTDNRRIKQIQVTKN
jgi:putative hemolysin